MNVADVRENIKPWLDRGLADWGLFAVVFLIGLSSFGLGRLSALEDARPPVSIQQAPTEAAPRGMSVGGLIVASKSGSVYYFPWCAGAQKITEQNKRWFPDEASAERAGYASSKACKGLGTQ